MKKFLPTLLVLGLSISLSDSVYAAEPLESDMNPKGLEIESIKKYKFEVAAGGEEIATDSEEIEKTKNLHSIKTMDEDIIKDLSNGIKLQDKDSKSGFTQSWTATIANQGDIVYVTTTLAPNQILNATLVCPKNENLNYDLFVYEMDNLGNLTKLVARSNTETYMNEYTDGTVKTIDESAGFVNKGFETKEYAIIVAATEGGSTTDTFELILNRDEPGNYDIAEPSDREVKVDYEVDDEGNIDYEFEVDSEVKVDYEFDGDMGAKNVAYHEGKKFRFEDNFSVTIQVTNQSEIPIENYPVELVWESDFWETSISDSGITDEEGMVTLELSASSSAGLNSYFISGAIDFTHYYDVDKVFIKNSDTDEELEGPIEVYHFAYSVYEG
ncbi:hypothetical protein AN640_00680 [Candidatus Epulonipiscium fishelsonii]|uniref:Uncharacterized protein n=1 Tax=Candidatus Epulonipiscium fishelsonii TaxID=77094 RepID=A0ACC8XJP4_9FIRM|nr:hypothetical protein AN640_00680 [Epulopiscium sp. SCG-D08WGA-EpuloA1]